jgi:hypothetical protein
MVDRMEDEESTEVVTPPPQVAMMELSALENYLQQICPVLLDAGNANVIDYNFSSVKIFFHLVVPSASNCL